MSDDNPGFFRRRVLATKTFLKEAWNHATSAKTLITAAATVGAFAVAGHTNPQLFNGFFSNMFGGEVNAASAVAKYASYVAVGTGVSAVIATVVDPCGKKKKNAPCEHAPHTPGTPVAQISHGHQQEYDVTPGLPPSAMGIRPGQGQGRGNC